LEKLLTKLSDCTKRSALLRAHCPLFPREKVDRCQLLGFSFIYKKNFAYMPVIADFEDKPEGYQPKAGQD
jgi:hypothetical protein